MNNKLLICAKITRKYILGDKDFFIQSFPNLPKKDLEQIWQLGFDAIRHSELIKNVQQINIFQSKINQIMHGLDFVRANLDDILIIAKKLKIT